MRGEKPERKSKNARGGVMTGRTCGVREALVQVQGEGLVEECPI